MCVCGAWPPAGDHIAVRGHGGHLPSADQGESGAGAVCRLA